jgi:hypothetical protein
VRAANPAELSTAAAADCASGLDYNKTFDIDPAKSFGIGGQAELDFNLTSLSASSASFQAVGLLQTRNLRWSNTGPPLTKHESAARNTVSPGPGQQSALTPPNW